MDFLDVNWQIADTRENLSDYSFVVQRSESPEGPFESVSRPLVGAFAFRDKGVDLAARWRTYYYRLEIKKIVGGETTYSLVQYNSVQPDRAGLYMVREHQLLLKVHIGTPVQVFKRRTFGPECPNCYDSIRSRGTDSNCTVCFSSRYRGGYLAPIPTFANFTAGNRAISPSAQVETETNDKTLDMSGYPPMVFGDMVVEPTNKRWRVVSVQEHVKQGFVIRQIVRVTAIALLDVAQKFPIDPSLFPTRNGELWPTVADFGPIKFVPEEPAGR